MLPEDVAAKKAELINYGKIYIPKGFALPYYPSRSTAGPGAGSRSLVFGFYGTRVKLTISWDADSVFSLVRRSEMGGDGPSPGEAGSIRECVQGSPYVILKHGVPFLDEVSLEPTIMHAPCQAFINITSRCIYDCSFCATPRLELRDKSPTPERWVELILNHANNSNLGAVAITSGVASSPHETVLDMVKVITGVRKAMPEIPIGVEPYVTAPEDIELLKNAGATEIKINLETPRREIFDKICPGMDHDGIRSALEYSVVVFGRNRVCSNIIIGLGETDEEVLGLVEELAAVGVVATVRAIRVNDENMARLSGALGFSPEPVPPERMLKLAKEQKDILDNHGLATEAFLSMCHRCKSCDLVPQQDV